MSFKFTWAHPAKEVFVTGSFDGWSKSVELEKHGEGFEKTVPLPHVVDKILYKFVADGTWIHDHTAKTETDHEGNVNNVLYPSDITHDSGIISSVAPNATTTKMAAEQPKGTPADAPGAFPQTPAAEREESIMSVNPIPASSGLGNPIKLAPGEPVPHPSTFNSNSVTSTVRDDPELLAADQTISATPIPATGGLSNPIQLAPGEEVPHHSTLTGHTLESNVKLDKASYDAAPVLPAPLSPGSEREAAGAPIFPEFGGSRAMIPESSLPMGVSPAIASENVGPTISSAAPTSTTAQLAGAVPLEPRGVPEVVERSQEEAHASPEASANPEAVAEKSALEQELKQKVPEEPATTTSGVFGRSEAGYLSAAAGGLAAAGVAIGAAISSVAPSSTTAALAGQVPKEERGVPEMVSESQQEAHVSPEASSNPEAVREKSEVEKELQAAVVRAPATTESGMFGNSERGVTGAVAAGVAAAGAAAAGTAYALRGKTTQATGTDPVSVLPASTQKKVDGDAVTSATITNVTEDTAVPRQFALGEAPRVNEARGDSSSVDRARMNTTSVPSEVTTSQKEARFDPEASANSEAVKEKSEVEQELLSKVKQDNSTGVSAPGLSAALSSQAPGTTSSTGAPQLNPISASAPLDLGSAGTKENKPPVSGDVSPMTQVEAPTVTSGVATARIPSRQTPEKRNSFMDRLKGTPESASSAATDSDSKKNRRSFFGKLKDKFKS